MVAKAKGVVAKAKGVVGQRRINRNEFTWADTC